MNKYIIKCLIRLKKSNNRMKLKILKTNFIYYNNKEKRLITKL